MRIGIDAKWYFEGPPSGKRVIRNIVDQILKMEDNNTYYIFLNKKHKNTDFNTKGKKGVELCYVWAGNNFLSNVFVLPFFSNRYKIDSLLYQNFASPFDRSKKVAYVHDILFLSNPEYYTTYERLYFAPLKFLTKKADLIITVSLEEKKRLLAWGFSKNADKIVVAHHGVESSFQPLERYPIEMVQDIKHKFHLPDSFLLFVGRLNLRKNIEALLRAIPLLKNKTIPLVIVGAEDWKKSKHLEVVNVLGIKDRIQFTGAVYENLGVIFSLSTVFCFPSHAESFGLPPLEAMASGVPVVVSNTTSLPEVCGDAGSYVDPNKPEEIAMAIDDLLDNEQLYKEKRIMGLQQSKKFTWDRATQIIINSMERNEIEDQQ